MYIFSKENIFYRNFNSTFRKGGAKSSTFSTFRKGGAKSSIFFGLTFPKGGKD